MWNTVVSVRMTKYCLLNSQGIIRADAAFAFVLTVFAKFFLGFFDAEALSGQYSILEQLFLLLVFAALDFYRHFFECCTAHHISIV